LISLTLLYTTKNLYESSIILIYLHLILPSIPNTSFVNDGRGVESPIVTPFSVKPLDDGTLSVIS